MKTTLSIIALSAALILYIVREWGISGLVIAAFSIGLLCYVLDQTLKWWEHRQFIKWCAKQIWNITVVSEYPNDPRPLTEAERIAKGLIESGNPLRVKVHAVIHTDSYIRTFINDKGKVKKVVVPAVKKTNADIKPPPIEDFGTDYPNRVRWFKNADTVSRDEELAFMLDSKEISQEFYEKIVLKQKPVAVQEV